MLRSLILETQVFASMGLYNTLSELMKFRGGDLAGFDAMNKSISQTGSVSLKAIEPLLPLVWSLLRLLKCSSQACTLNRLFKNETRHFM